MKSLVLFFFVLGVAFAQAPVVRNSDPANAVPQLPHQSALIFDYRGVNCTTGLALTSTTVPDCGPNKYDATAATGNGGTLPVNSALGVTCAVGAQNTIQTPAAASTGMQTLLLFMDAVPTGTTTYQSYVASTTSNKFTVLNNVGGAGVNANYAQAPVTYSNSAFITKAAEAFTGPGMLAITMGGTDHIYLSTPDGNYINESAYVSGFQGNTATTVTGAGALTFCGDTPLGYYYSGTFYRAVGYNVALTQQEVSAAFYAVRESVKARGLVFKNRNTNTTNQLLILGDSIPAGVGSGVTTPWPQSLSTTDTFTLLNYSTSGIQLASILPTIAAAYAPLYNQNAARNVVIIEASTNDACAAGVTSVANHVAAARIFHAYGWQVIAQTILDRSGCTAAKHTQTANILGSWTSWADYLIDFTNTAVGVDGAASNATNFPDGVNPSQTIHTSTLAPIYSAAINALGVKSQLPGGAKTITATTYTQLANDGELRCSPASNSVNITAISSIGQTGLIRSFKNIQSSGTNTCTITAAGTETIDGAGTKPIANLGSVQLISNGAGWDILNQSTGAGLTTLNTLTAASQTFANSNDTNVTLGISSATSTHTFTLGWTGTLAGSRGGTGVNNGSNTFTLGGNVVFNGAFNPIFAIPSSSTWTFPSGGGPLLTTPTFTISTSGPVTDPGGPAVFLFNNAAGALTFNLPAGAVGTQRCYRNATGKSGVITIAVTTSNNIDLSGANGTTTTGTLVSGGALGDSICLVSDATNHWNAYIGNGTWTNN